MQKKYNDISKWMLIKDIVIKRSKKLSKVIVNRREEDV